MFTYMHMHMHMHIHMHMHMHHKHRCSAPVAVWVPTCQNAQEHSAGAASLSLSL